MVKSLKTKNRGQAKAVVKLDSLKQINLNAAGLDIGSAEIWGCVPEGRDEVSVRVFETFTADLHALADLLPDEVALPEPSPPETEPPDQPDRGLAVDVRLLNRTGYQPLAHYYPRFIEPYLCLKWHTTGQKARHAVIRVWGRIDGQLSNG